MKRVALIITMICLVAAAYGQYDPAALKKLDAMSAKYKNAPAFSAAFAQNLKNPAAGLDESIEGNIAVKNDKYLLEVSGQYVYNNSKDIYTYNPEINEVTIAPYEADEQEISLNNIYDIYKTGFKYGIYEVIKGVTFIDLDPEDKSDKSYFKIRMEIDGNDNLQAFSVFEPSGNVYRYSITDFLERADITDDYFVFDIRKHTNDQEIIDSLEEIDFR